ncbi:helix-turn-helix domain-containing protein [Streptomyces sp. NPDC017979]|uniref:helix-turn-helix domain-containing protein n=1 Tax=Streptomyces sp. NPDC017979 TaxID=3365024 RepID=UPI0037B3E95A
MGGTHERHEVSGTTGTEGGAADADVSGPDVSGPDADVSGPDVSGPDAGGARALAALGVPPDEEFLYRALLTRPRATVAELASATGWNADRVRRRTRALEQRGMLLRTACRPARFTPAPPDVVLDALARRREEEIARARLAAVALTDAFRTAGPEEGPALQQLGGDGPSLDRMARRLQTVAREEVLTLGVPDPGAPPGGPGVPPGGPGTPSVVRRRALYDPGSVPVQPGVEGRLLVEPAPLALVVADRRTALVRGPGQGREAVEGAVLLRPSALLDGLLTLYELLWQRSVPPGDDAADGPLSAADQQLLSLSAAGLTDRAIARRLGVAQRTVERRMRRIMNALGARTRFQAGLQAAGHGISAVRSAPGTCPHR